MQLELVFKRQITKRLDKFKEVLGKGKLLSQNKIGNALGAEIEHRKEAHDRMIEK